MKPRAPALIPDKDQPSLETELDRLCEAKAGEGRVTVPAPPSAEALRAATPLPPEPPESTHAALTTPAPPIPSQVVRRSRAGEEEAAAGAPDTAIPRPPRVPRISRG